MATYHYTLPWPVLDVATGQLLAGRTDGVLIDDVGNAQPVTTPAGLPTDVVTGPTGVTAPFRAQIPYGRVRFGTVEAAVFSNENMGSLQAAQAAAADAAATRAAVEFIAENATEISYMYRDAAGDVWVSEEPVVVGGGRPRLDPYGDVWVDFP